MTKAIFGFATAVFISLPGLALADSSPIDPIPAVAGKAAPHFTPRRVFHWLDTNHDGFLTLSEFLAAPWVTDKARAAEFFHWLDINNDGRVSLPEFLAAYSAYNSNRGYVVRHAYPWAWSYWRPWNYGWYWHSGWRRHSGAWPAYTVHVNRHFNHGHSSAKHFAHGNHPHHATHGKHPHAGKHHPARHRKHAGGHQGHGHSHAKHHK